MNNPTRSTTAIPHLAIMRAPGLLPMLYRPSELADELAVPAPTIRWWIQHRGIPHQRDARGHLWISGRDFAQWVTKIQKQKKARTLKLEKHQAYCVRCRQAVRLENPTKVVNGKAAILSSICPNCGCKVNRGVRNG